MTVARVHEQGRTSKPPETRLVWWAENHETHDHLLLLLLLWLRSGSVRMVKSRKFQNCALWEEAGDAGGFSNPSFPDLLQVQDLAAMKVELGSYSV